MVHFVVSTDCHAVDRKIARNAQPHLAGGHACKCAHLGSLFCRRPVEFRLFYQSGKAAHFLEAYWYFAKGNTVEYGSVSVNEILLWAGINIGGLVLEPKL